MICQNCKSSWGHARLTHYPRNSDIYVLRYAQEGVWTDFCCFLCPRCRPNHIEVGSWFHVHER